MEEIKSDVDKLLDFLSSNQGYFSFNDVAERTGMPLHKLRKWVHVFEGRKQVRVRYNLSTEEVRWIGAQRAQTAGHYFSAENVPVASQGAEDAAVEIAKKFEGEYQRRRELGQVIAKETLPISQKSEIKKEIEEEIKELEGEKESQQYEIAAEKDAGDGENRHVEYAIKQKRMVQRIFPTATPVSTSTLDALELSTLPVRAAPAELEAKAEQIGEKISQLNVPEAMPIEFGMPAKLPASTKHDKKLLEINKELTEQMNKIERKAEDIDRLKAQKQKLFVKVLQPLQTKLSDDVQNIAQRLMDYENSIIRLREHAAGLSGEVDEASARQERVIKIVEEMQRAYDETSHVLDDSHAGIMDSREKVSEQVETIKQGINSEITYMQQMKTALQSIAQIQAEIEARMQEAHQTIVAQQAQLNSAEEKLGQLGGLRAELEGKMHEANGELKHQKQMLGGLETHLTKIDEVHRWISENKADYDNRMKALADYIMSAEADYNTIRESVETGFVRRYLKDLRSVSQSYEYEISQAQRLEEDIDSRIATSKLQMHEMIHKAKQIADLQEMALVQNEEEVKEKAIAALSRSNAAERILKGKERAQIKAVIRQAIDGEPASRPMKISVRTRAKAVAKKAQKKHNRR